MKKGIIGLLMLLSVMTFARGGNGQGTFDGGQRQFLGGNQNVSANYNQRRIIPIYSDLTEEQKAKLEKVEKLRAKKRDEGRKTNLEIKEKNIAIQKEMLEDNVDWSKVEKIQKEIEKLKTEQKIIRLKEKKEIEKILGDDISLLKKNKRRSKQNNGNRGNNNKR
ncbi:MAG: hypothetical protein B6I28_02060 [Fusobacteriia bacterium 4572_132]|nr:MAG: hypothetical protein B6I28_02060 [Fusobacteriia bacterium 4572_132]